MTQGKIIRSTDKAHLVQSEGDEQWIPRSVFTYCKKWPADDKGHIQIQFTLEEWFAKKIGWD